MRTVILYNSFWYVFLLRRNLVASLMREGHSLYVVAPEDQYSDRVRQLGVTCVPIEMNRSGTSLLQEARTLSQIFQALKRINPTSVLSFTAKCNVYAGLCRRRLGFQHVANISGLGQLFDGGRWLQRAVHLLYRVSFAKTDDVFFQNPEDLAQLTGVKAVAPESASLLPGSGVDLSRFYPATKRVGNVRSFLMFGRLLPKKGFYRFIQAAEQLKRVHGDRVVFWILGAADYERSESVDLLQSVMDAHARGVVRYLQSTDDTLPYLHEADIVVLPSTYNEGVPRSLLEALACGKPVVTTNWKGCRETVEDGQNGLLVAPESTPSLIEALNTLATLDESSLAAMGKRSREIAEQRFDERVVIERYLNALARNPARTGFSFPPVTAAELCDLR
jgi:glycosyltransferase involved in cell wall biosynthesis